MLLFRIIKVGLLSLFILASADSASHARALKLCTHLGFEPFVIKQGTSLTGIDIDIIIKALTNMKQPADIKAYPWSRLLSSLKNGRCDIGFALFDTEERRQYVDYIFTVPLHYSTYSLFVPKGKEFKFLRVSDVFGKTIAQNRGFSLTVGLEQAVQDGRIKRVFFDKAEAAIKLLENGRVDAVLDNDQRFRYHLKQKKKLRNFSILNIPFLPHHPAFLVVSKKSDLPNKQEIKDKLENQLKKLHLNGSILNITTKYTN